MKAALLLLSLLTLVTLAQSEINLNFANLLSGLGSSSGSTGGTNCPTCPTCRFANPDIIHIFGAKPPALLIGNITQAFLEKQQPNFRILPDYRQVANPETISADGIEMLLRGFGDIASSGRYLQASDFTARGCNGSFVQPDGSSSGECYGRKILNIGFVNDNIYFGVHPSNPVTDVTKAQLSQIVNTTLAGTPATWSQVWPTVTFPASLANEPVRFLNGPPGGGIPQSVNDLTGVPTNSITPISSAANNQIRSSTTNWLTFFVYATPPSPSAAKGITYNGIGPETTEFEINHTFNFIIDINNEKANSVKEFVCFALDYQFDGAKFNLFPLTSAQRNAEKAKLGC